MSRRQQLLVATIAFMGLVPNVGDRDGDEVVQLYVTHPHSSVDRPQQELKGFQRVSIHQNETKTVEITLRAKDLAYWDEKMSRMQVEAETIGLIIGNSSKDIKMQSTIQVR